MSEFGLRRLVIGMMFGVVSAMGAQSPMAVTVEGGRLQGAQEGEVVSFKGVPFAAPPVGPLRWRAPQPAAKWQGVRQANTYGADCMQMPFPGDAAPLGVTPKEDCLYVNVWRPAAVGTEKLPVMIWIYGGGFVNGGSSPAVYDGSEFALRGVVFVSFNYRLGRFGFFGHPALTAADADGGMLGNYGFMDQIAALKWVQRNIGAFGGDAGNVTVFGESAGGFSVHMLLTSPLASGLFGKAIIESGGGRANLGGLRFLSAAVPNGPPSAEAAGLAFAKSAGVEGTGPEALAALRALPAETVRGNLNMATSRTPTYAGPMVDGKVVVTDPGTVYLAGAGQHVPLIIGTNSMDIGFVSGDTMDALLKPFGGDRQRAEAAYDPGHGGSVPAVRMKVGADRMMNEPARFVARTFAAEGQPAYLYHFSYVAESMRKQWPGAPHATEIPFVFDTVKARYGKDLVPVDETTAKAAIGYWVAFAKTGDPNGEGRPNWPRYTQDGEQVLDFGNDGVRAVADPWKARLDVTESYVTSTPPPVP